jgi:hypothetical protein
MASRALLATCFIIVSYLAYFRTLKMEPTCSSETSADFQPITRRYIPEDRTLLFKSSGIYPKDKGSRLARNVGKDLLD